METEEIFRIVQERVLADTPKRRALSSRYPFLLPFILGARRLLNNLKNTLNPNITREKSNAFFRNVIARHSSPLFRKLGNSDPNLQKGKARNLKIAVDKLSGLIIPPNKIFSFWSTVGAVTKKNGYVNGMLLSEGQVREGVGGGLCQLSNLLYWLFLHTPVTILERTHHSRDIFPDSGRTVPFGAGATIFYNLIDLKVKNTSSYPIQLKVWMSDTHLKGAIVSSHPPRAKYHLTEKNHFFVETNKGIYRHNEIWRETLVRGQLMNEEKIMTNCAPVLYTPRSVDLYLDKELKTN